MGCNVRARHFVPDMPFRVRSQDTFRDRPILGTRSDRCPAGALCKTDALHSAGCLPDRSNRKAASLEFGREKDKILTCLLDSKNTKSAAKPGSDTALNARHAQDEGNFTRSGISKETNAFIRSHPQSVCGRSACPTDTKYRDRLPGSNMKMAETEGFEPSIPLSGYAHLANECLQPLGHVSVGRRSRISRLAGQATFRGIPGIVPVDTGSVKQSGSRITLRRGADAGPCRSASVVGRRESGRCGGICRRRAARSTSAAVPPRWPAGQARARRRPR